MNRWASTGCVFAFLGVAAGAFGAHALRPHLDADLLAVYETAARYQLIHALALILAGLAEGRLATRPLGVAGVAFTTGIILFSGSLYALAGSGIRAFGLVTPFGGLAFLIGWAAFLAAAIRAPRRDG